MTSRRPGSSCSWNCWRTPCTSSAPPARLNGLRAARPGRCRTKTLGMLEWSGFQDYVEVMSKVASQHFGQVELNHGREHNVSATHELAGHPVELDLNVTAHDRFDEAALHKV